METMAQPGYSDPASMTDVSISFHPATSDQSYLSSASNDFARREWPAWDGQVTTSLYAQDNSCDTLGPLPWDEGQVHLTFGAAEPTANDAVARWQSQTTSWPIYHQQHPQQPLSTGFSQQVQWPASTTHPSPAMSSEPQPVPETHSQINSDTASNRSRALKSRPSPSSSIPGPAPKKKRTGHHGQSSPATSTDDSVHVIEDSDDDVEHTAQPAVRPRVEKGKTTYRAKNRVAAKRCREKTKQYEIDLANKEKKVTEERMYLDACVTALKNEVLTLKNQILQHSDCDCDMIQGYIARAANGISLSAARMPS